MNFSNTKKAHLKHPVFVLSDVTLSYITCVYYTEIHNSHITPRRSAVMRYMTNIKLIYSTLTTVATLTTVTQRVS